MDLNNYRDGYSWLASGRRTYPVREGDILGLPSTVDRYSSYGKDYSLGLRNFERHSTTYSRDYVTDSMSRYSSRTYDSGIGSRRYDTTSSRPYTSGSSYTSGSYSGSRSFDSGRYGSSSGSRYGGSSYTSDLTGSSSRYGISGVSSSRYDTSGTTLSYGSSRTSIPVKTDDISGRRGSRSSLTSDLSLDSRDIDLYDSSRRRSLRSDKSDILGAIGRRSSYKDESLTEKSSYTSRRLEREKTGDSDSDRYKSSRKTSLRDSSSVESTKDNDVPRSQYRHYSADKDKSISNTYKSSLDRTASLDNNGDVSSYSHRRALRKQQHEEGIAKKLNEKSSATGPNPPSTAKLSYRARRELDRTATESTDSDASITRKATLKCDDEPTGYESFADRRQRRKESLESINSNSTNENECANDKTRWRSFASDSIKEASTPVSTDVSFKRTRVQDNKNFDQLETKEVFCAPELKETTDISSNQNKETDSKNNINVEFKEKSYKCSEKEKSPEISEKREISTLKTDSASEEVTRAERIAKYKEQRRRQLQNMGNKIELQTDSSSESKGESRGNKSTSTLLESKEVVLPAKDSSKITIIKSEKTSKAEKEEPKAKQTIEKQELSTNEIPQPTRLLSDKSNSQAVVKPQESVKEIHETKPVKKPSIPEQLTMSVEIQQVTKCLESQEIKKPINKIKDPTNQSETKTLKALDVTKTTQSTDAIKKPAQKTTGTVKEKSPPPRTRVGDSQDKQKIVQDTSRTRTSKLPSPRITKKSIQNEPSSPNKPQATKSPAKIENGRHARAVPTIKKTEDGLKVSRKTVSERFAKTQIAGRKPSSGVYSSDDEEGRLERPHPPRSPAARRAKSDASKSPLASSSKRKVADGSKASPLSKSLLPTSETPKEKVKIEVNVPASPGNLDDLLKQNVDYLSDDSILKTPSPTCKSNNGRNLSTAKGSIADDKTRAAPFKTFIKEGQSQPDDNNENLLNTNDIKGVNSSKTVKQQSESKETVNDSDDGEFNTAPSTPQIDRSDKTGQKAGESHDIHKGTSESTSYGSKSTVDESGVNSKPIKRGNDFSQLLQKFSSSELSSSERSEQDFNSRSGLSRNRQARSVSISSSDESNTERQTPERTQSFKLRTVKEKDESSPVQRSSSFKSSFMSKRFQSEATDKPSEELSSVLQSRSDKTENNTKVENKYDNLDKTKTIVTTLEETIVDKELSAVLKSRRKETDSIVESLSKSDTDPKPSSHIISSSQAQSDTFISDNIANSKSKLYKIDSSLAELSRVTEELDKPESTISKGYISPDLGRISPEKRCSSSASLSDAVQYIKDVETSISTRISKSISKSHDSLHKINNHSETTPVNTSMTFETKMTEPRPLHIIGAPYGQLELTQTLEVRNVTLDESSTDDVISSAITSKTSTPPLIIHNDQTISAKEDDAKLHDPKKDRISSSSNSSRNVIDSSRRDVISERSTMASSNKTNNNKNQVEHNERNGAVDLVKSHSTASTHKTNTNLGEVIKNICAENVDVYTKTGDIASSTCLQSDTDSLHSDIVKRKDLLSVSSGRYLDVSESTILTSSGIELSETSTDETGGSRVSKPLNRSESLKTSGVKRTESFERRKGILKRTPSLPKQPSGPIVDKQLAKILEQRRLTIEVDAKKEEEEKPPSRRLSVTDEILETMRREKENKPENEDNEDEDEQSKLSVAERIFKMQTKIEEEKYAATPRSRSGIATPKSPFRIRSGAVSPRKQMSFDDFSQDGDPTFTGEILMERLTTLAEDGKVETIMERRRKLEESQRKFKKVQKPDRDNSRRRTQPITLEEITEADSLDSVNTFRSLVRKKASTSVFEHLVEQKPKLPANKKSEFPEHLQPQKKRRSRGERYQTLPVTAAELMCIPENEMMESDTLRSKVMARGRQDSKADSGILSGSDNENLSAASDSLRSLSLEMDLAEDDPSRNSVSSKTSFFKQIDEKTSKERYKGSASGAKRYIDRKKRERYLTQPITEEEVKTAAEYNDEQKTVTIPVPEVVNRAKSVEPQDSTVEDDDLTKLSLKDKVKLFANKKEEEEKPLPPKQNAPMPRRRNRKQASRFSTQPITSEEVEKAAKISPLHMSLVKPPDPEILKGLSLKAQRELAACHAEATLSQPSSRSNSRPNSRPGSQPGSRRASFTEEEPMASEKVTVSHAKSDGDLQKNTGILRCTEIRQSNPDLEVKSILKIEKERKDQEPRGILKRAETIETSKPSDETRGILKHGDSPSPESNRRSRDSRETESEPRTILHSEDSNLIGRGILKKDSSFEVKKTEPERGVLKKIDNRTEESPVRSILKKDLSDDENGLDNSQSIPGSAASLSDVGSKRRSRHNDRYLTQPAELVTPEKSPQSKRRIKYEGRHMTQPVTPDEFKEAEETTPVTMKGGSVADRLSALKKSGEEEWKKRVPKSLDFESPQEIKLREKKGLLIESRPVSLADRLNLLDVNKTTWKERVEEKDTSKFTVAGKISQTAGTVASPLVSRLKNKRNGMSLDLGSKENSPNESPVTTPTHERIPLPKDIITHASSTSVTKVKTVTEIHETASSRKIESVTVEIPQFSSADVDAFFNLPDENEERIDLDIDDFNDIFINSNDILPSVKKIRPVRKQAARTANPLKNMSVEIKTEYTEVTTGLAELELKRVKVEKIAKDNTGFAQEALAGLASKENFSKVALRKMDVTSTPGSKDRLEPYKDIMLLHVKGRRNVQTRLVQPSSVSINSGDCYVLITPEKIINWIGSFSNVIEKAKSADITNYIHQKRDMGCRSTTVSATVEEEKQRLGAGKHFWASLGGQQEYQAVGPEEEDEIYETCINKTNMVFKLEDNSLKPYQEYWGAALKYSMLDPEITLAFDFGAELYLWLGKKVSPEDRKIGRLLCQELWDRGYDYTPCDINPLSPLHTEDTGSVPIKSNTRPDWALFGKVHQGMETLLFKEKFVDWPDNARIIKVKGQDDEKTEKKVEVAELQAFDVDKMVPINKSPVTLVLEGSHVGRGTKWLEDMQGFMREFEIVTLGVDMWHVMEYDHYKLDETSYGQFHDGDTYVVRWQYMISNAGLKSLKGQAARKSITGRERYAYFFWQGKESTINEKGASALMTVELDEERGPQIRVIQGKEPPCFLNLFHGSMIVHIGKREEEESNTQGPWRLYCVRNELENELCVVEIKLCVDNLRSRSSLILLNVKTGHLYIWHGCKSPDYTRKNARIVADKLKDNCPLEVGLHKDASILITEMEEGEEKSQIWGALESRDRSLYMSLLNEPRSLEHTVRLFHMTSVSGVFEVIELLNPARCEDLYTPFPFLQSDLYKVSQPALFLVDNHREVYLWHGWWPEGKEEEENMHTGSAIARFNIDRKCALETMVNYCRESRKRMPKMYIVYGGVEPQQFINIFPYWVVDEQAKELNIKDGKREGYLESAEDILAKLKRTQYTFAELQERPLPEGVDASKLESYLDEEEFQSLLHMSKEEYYALPSWKQRQLKQPTGLF
ncbi:microtubule-associated protein futsch isoform X3 [Patella vulgata]|uniref:microtubule-associated protein futsch isoform X3 n=1 Tax=Patella vulgata TaxID=6465 RepID=UPI0024A830F1|nr:microtubule-associated protein futsch isoform X3 [Patella vulgata]